MTAEYVIITLVYAHPKHVSVLVRATCKCGTITANSKVCATYGRVIVECRRCHEKVILPLDRDTIAEYHQKHFPHVGGLDHFLDKWEDDMKKL